MTYPREEWEFSKERVPNSEVIDAFRYELLRFWHPNRKPWLKLTDAEKKAEMTYKPNEVVKRPKLSDLQLISNVDFSHLPEDKAELYPDRISPLMPPLNPLPPTNRERMLLTVEIDADASPAEVSEAIKKLLKRKHPKKSRTRGKSTKKESRGLLKAIGWTRLLAYVPQNSQEFPSNIEEEGVTVGLPQIERACRKLLKKHPSLKCVIPPRIDS